MATDLIKAASEARKFIKSLEALAAIGPALEKFGQLQQVRDETQRAIDAGRTEVAKLREEQAEIARANAEAREEAQTAAAIIVDDAEKAAAAINANVKAVNDELSAENGRLQALLDDRAQTVAALERAAAERDDEIASLRTQLEDAQAFADRAKEAAAALTG